MILSLELNVESDNMVVSFLSEKVGFALGCHSTNKVPRINGAMSGALYPLSPRSLLDEER